MLDSTDTFTTENVKELVDNVVDYVDSIKIQHTINLNYDDNYLTDKNLVVMDNKGNFSVESIKVSDIKSAKMDNGIGISSIYKFESFEEKSDSIIFCGLKAIFAMKKMDRISFKKGGIFVKQQNGIVKEISFSLSKVFKVNDGFRIGQETMVFIPSKPLMMSKISDYGFFKQIQ